MQNNRKRTFALLAAALFLTGTLAACTKADTSGGGTSDAATADLSTQQLPQLPEITAEDEEQVIDTSGATAIVFHDATASVNGSGASAAGSTVTVKQAGTYTVSGKTEDGCLVVDAGDQDTVKLVFENAEITSTTSSAIYVKNAGKTILNAAENTVNILTDAATYTGQTDGEPDSTVYAKDDLTINGGGTFRITGNYNDAVKSNDTLRITGALLQIQSADDGVVGKDYVLMTGGALEVEAAGDGVKSTYDTDASKGAVSISGGTLQINAGADGVQAHASVVVSGGTLEITAGGGSENAAQKASTSAARGAFFGETTSTDESTGSYKGIKCSNWVVLTGGTYTIHSADDAIHSNQTVQIGGGSFVIDTGDDGIHADACLEIAGGTIEITKSYEGLEAAEIRLSGGEIFITASDDGINAAGGNDNSNASGPMGGDRFESSSGSVSISGGYVVLDASGDGLDSNGGITMTGGTVLINGPVNSANGALDYTTTFEMTGGTLVAAGAAGMAQSISTSSSVYAVSVGASGSAGTAVRILNADAEEVFVFAPSKSFSNVLIAAPCLEKGETYTVVLASFSGGNNQDGVLTGATYSSESTVGTFTANTISSTVGNGGGMMGGGQGGGQPQGGGMRPGR